MISTSIGGKRRQKWELIPTQLSLEEALKILNPDNRDFISNKRGAYKRIVIELRRKKMNKDFNVGDKVRINLDLVKDDCKKYNKVYTIKEIRKDFQGRNIYFLNGVKGCGTQEMLIKEDKSEIHKN